MPKAVRFSARLSQESRRPAVPYSAMRVLRARRWFDVALIALVIALGVWVYLGTGSTTGGKDRLTVLSPDDVKRITVTRAEGDPIELTRGEAGWTLKHGGGEVPVGSLHMRTLLELVSTPVLSHYPVKSLKLSDADLDPPKLKLNVDGTLIQMGGVNALTQRRYVLMGDEVKLIQDHYFDLFSDGPAQYVSGQLVPAGWKLRKLTVPGQTIEADGKDGWHRVGETKPEGQDKSADLAHSWQQASAIAVSESGDDEALQEIGLSFDGGRELRFLVVATDPELVLARPDVKLAYHFGLEQAKQLLPGPATSPTPQSVDQAQNRAGTPADGGAAPMVPDSARNPPATGSAVTPPVAGSSAGNNTSPEQPQGQAATSTKKTAKSSADNHNKKSSSKTPRSKKRNLESSSEEGSSETSVKSEGNSAAPGAASADGPKAIIKPSVRSVNKNASLKAPTAKARTGAQGSGAETAGKSTRDKSAANPVPAAESDTPTKPNAQKRIKNSQPSPASNVIDD